MQIIQNFLSSPKKSLIESCRKAYDSLLQTDSGKFNIILTNGHITFVFIHWRPFYVLHREKDSGDVALVSTIQLSRQEEWVEFNHQANKRARMLVFNGPTLLLNGDIPA